MNFPIGNFARAHSATDLQLLAPCAPFPRWERDGELLENQTQR